MSRRKVSTTIYITPEQDTALKALQRRNGVPVAEYIRRAIDALLAEHRHELPPPPDPRVVSEEDLSYLVGVDPRAVSLEDLGYVVGAEPAARSTTSPRTGISDADLDALEQS